jgi:hypothetical protein
MPIFKVIMFDLEGHSCPVELRDQKQFVGKGWTFRPTSEEPLIKLNHQDSEGQIWFPPELSIQ